MSDRASEARGIQIALVSYSGLVALQLGSYLWTGILILLAQGLELLGDVVVSGFLLLSLMWSRKPADEYHMFGHGRAQNVAGFVAATVMILFMSVEVFREALPRFFQSGALPDASESNLALIVIVVSMTVLAVPLLVLRRSGMAGASAKAQRVQILKDEAAFIPAIAGILLLSQGYSWANPVTSSIIGVLIVVSGMYLVKDNVHYLIGRSPGEDFLKRVEKAALSVPGVLGVRNIKAEYVGPGLVHAGLHIEVGRRTTIEEANRLVHEVDERVSQATNCYDCVIQVDPADEG